MRCLGAIGAVAAILIAASSCRAIGFDDLPDPGTLKEPPGPKAPDAPEKPAPAPPADGETFEWRDAHCPLNQVCKEDSFALPLAKAAAGTPPHKVLAGKAAGEEGGSGPRERLWAVIPLKEGHGEFIERYAAAKSDDDKLRLVEWCRQRRFEACAEFLARDVLFANWGNLSSPAYRQALDVWLPLAATHRPPFTFDLPIRGVWYVQTGTAEIHRRNHSSAFTQNLYIQVNGRRCKGSEDDLTGYFAWGQPFYAVGDGIIRKVEDQYPDPPVGRTGDWRVANAIYQDLGGGACVHYGHIKKGSALVKEGDRVTRGQALGQVGNSGSDGKPHLHFTLLDGDWFSVPGRFRYEQMTPRGWVLRDGAPLEEGACVRPVTAAKAETPKPAKRAPRLPMPTR